jgi:hypothetical protein
VRPPGDAETSAGGKQVRDRGQHAVRGADSAGRVGARVPGRDTRRRGLPRSSVRVSASGRRVASGDAASGSAAALGAC